MLVPFDTGKFRSDWWPELSSLGFSYHQALASISLLTNYKASDLQLESETILMACLCTLFATRSQGHVCLPISEICGLWQQRMAVSQENGMKLFRFSDIPQNLNIPNLLISAGLAESETDLDQRNDQLRPLVLRTEDHEIYLYLRADQLAENQLAQQLATIQNSHNDPRQLQTTLSASLSDWMDSLTGDNALDYGQKSAVMAALASKFFILTGGPGTGKTTTVFHLLRALFHSYRIEHQNKPFIALCAPTGRAAARMGESLQQSRLRLETELQSALDREFVAVLDRTEGMTLHRLLGLSENFTADDYATILPFDIIIVDEASMIDLHLMKILIGRLGPLTRLILVGDQNQLPSVESGAILAELTQSTTSGIPKANLVKVFRSSLPILQCAQAVLSGDGQLALALANSNEHGLQLHRLLGPSQREAQRNKIINDWIYQEDLIPNAVSCALIHGAQPDLDLEQLFRKASKSVLLSPLHAGLCGTEKLNEQINDYIRSQLRTRGMKVGKWFPGQMVMAVQNDYEKGIYNGDRGLVYLQDGVLRVYFPGSLRNAALHPAPITIPGLESAFALTIHKSQGSEYERIHLFLSESTSNEGHVNRELLYTGITRAKSGLTLVIDESAFSQDCNTQALRWSRLGERLKALSPGIG